MAFPLNRYYIYLVGADAQAPIGVLADQMTDDEHHGLRFSRAGTPVAQFQRPYYMGWNMFGWTDPNEPQDKPGETTAIEHSAPSIPPIPPMTDPLGQSWHQPDRSEIQFTEQQAARMTREALEKLAEYSTSTPTGVYAGKMWKRRTGDRWLLCWYHTPYTQAGKEFMKIATLPVEITG